MGKTGVKFEIIFCNTKRQLTPFLAHITLQFFSPRYQPTEGRGRLESAACRGETAGRARCAQLRRAQRSALPLRRLYRDRGTR